MVFTAKNSVTLPLQSNFIEQKKGEAERGACSSSGLLVEPEQEVRPSLDAQYRGYHVDLSQASQKS